METTYTISFEVRSRAGRKLDWDTFTVTTTDTIDEAAALRAARARVSLKGSEYVVITSLV